MCNDLAVIAAKNVSVLDEMAVRAISTKYTGASLLAVIYAAGRIVGKREARQSRKHLKTFESICIQDGGRVL